MLTPLFEKYSQTAPNHKIFLKVLCSQPGAGELLYHLEIWDESQQHIMSTIELQDKGNGRWIEAEFGPSDTADEYGKFIEENLS